MLSPKIKARMPPILDIQHNTESSSQRNKARKRLKGHSDWKRKNKTVFIYKRHKKMTNEYVQKPKEL